MFGAQPRRVASNFAGHFCYEKVGEIDQQRFIFPGGRSPPHLQWFHGQFHEGDGGGYAFPSPLLDSIQEVPSQGNVSRDVLQNDR